MSREDLLRGLPRRPVPSAGGGLAAASAGPHLARHRPALDDDPLGGGRVDRSAVGVADDVGHAADQDGVQPLGQGGGARAAGLEVLGAALHHLGVVDLGELRIDPASVVRGSNQGGAQEPVAGLAHWLALAVGLAGSIRNSPRSTTPRWWSAAPSTSRPAAWSPPTWPSGCTPSWSAACPTSSATPTALRSTRPPLTGSSSRAGRCRSRCGPADAAASPPPAEGTGRRGRPLSKSSRDMSGQTRVAPTNEAAFPVGHPRRRSRSRSSALR